EVIRRLVEEEQVRASRECSRQRRARQLSTGERPQRTIELVVREAEAADGRGSAITPCPSARVLELRLRLGVAPQRDVVVRAVRHRVLEPPELSLEVEQVASAGECVLAERDVEVEWRALVV